MGSRTSFDVRFGQSRPEPIRAYGREVPVRVLILGDFSGSHTGERPSGLAARHPFEVDAGDVDALMKRIRPRLELTAAAHGSMRVNVSMTRLDDFHPDELYRTNEFFAGPATVSSPARGSCHFRRSSGRAAAEGGYAPWLGSGGRTA